MQQLGDAVQQYHSGDRPAQNEETGYGLVKRSEELVHKYLKVNGLGYGSQRSELLRLREATTVDHGYRAHRSIQRAALAAN